MERAEKALAKGTVRRHRTREQRRKPKPESQTLLGFV